MIFVRGCTSTNKSLHSVILELVQPLIKIMSSLVKFNLDELSLFEF